MYNNNSLGKLLGQILLVALLIAVGLVSPARALVQLRAKVTDSEPVIKVVSGFKRVSRKSEPSPD